MVEAMTEAVGTQQSKDARSEDGGVRETRDEHTPVAASPKHEEAELDVKPVNGDLKPVAAETGNDGGVEGDSEAETLIQSPEKQRSIVDTTSTDDAPPGTKAKDDDSTITAAAPESEPKSRKRKRGADEPQKPSASPSLSRYSSPLSSPVLAAQSAGSDSDVSSHIVARRPKNSRPKRDGGHMAESEEAEEKAVRPQARRRRPSDLLTQVPKQRQRQQGHAVDPGPSERRETRSATYPRHSSEERSPSPRPVSRRQHRRGVSTQLTAGDVERKKRGRPPLLSTRRNKSADRAASVSTEGSDSPRRTRPAMHKFTTADHDTMSPVKVTGPRKWRDKNGRTYLSRACNNNDLEAARARFAERPEDLNMADNAGNTPLQIAALEGFVEIVKFLLENGADVDTRNIDHETPLIDAVENGHVEVIKLLLDYEANPRLANAKGDEPYELVPADDENYAEIRKLLASAKEHEIKRRRSNDHVEHVRDGASSRAASAASPRDSPPMQGPRSPPALTSRRRTGRSESTRNDLLWQANTQDNLTRLAGKGDVQGVANILNILQKAETESLIAAAKAGHEDVLQYLLGMGDPEPDPDPVRHLKAGYNTPVLAAIGRGHPEVVKLLVDQSGFNPTRKYKGKTYFEISAERKGEDWQQEYDILKSAYDKHSAGKMRKLASPRALRDADKTKSRGTRRSMSPAAPVNARSSTSPTLTHKSLPNKSPQSSHKDKEAGSPAAREQRRSQSDRKETGDSSVAVSSDQDQTVTAPRKGHKIRRSQSDLPPPTHLENEVIHRRRRLVTGREHRRRKSFATHDSSDEGTEIEVKQERKSGPGLKRTRDSLSPEPTPAGDGHTARTTMVKKRRTVLESSPEESRPGLKRKNPRISGRDLDRPPEEKILSDVEEVFKRQRRTRSDQGAEAKTSTTSTSNGEAMEGVTPSESVTIQDTAASQDKVPNEADEEKERAHDDDDDNNDKEETAPPGPTNEEIERQKAEESRRAAEEAQRLENERIEAEKLANERRLAEEAEARRKAEEEAAIRKKEEEERQERMRRELEERKRRQEEQLRLQHLESERRRREALPAVLCKCALMLDTGDPTVRSPVWLSKFLPLFTVRSRQLDPDCAPSMQEEEWLPNFQVAGLLATKDLHLRNYTSLEKRPVSPAERECLWRVARHMLSYDYDANGLNTSIKQAIQTEEEERPKFYAMEELFWVKVCMPLYHNALPG